jgi:transcriptional regulator with XRE-family HTH domain
MLSTVGLTFMTATEQGEPYPSADEVLAEALQDATVRAKWDETKLARDVALWLVRHRGEHGLTQSGLAQQLGWKQPVVARLERGDHEPSMATLQHLVRTLGGQVRISIGPDGVRLIVPRRALPRLPIPASLESPGTAAHTLQTAARTLSVPMQGNRKPRKRRSPKAGNQNPSPLEQQPEVSAESLPDDAVSESVFEALAAQTSDEKVPRRRTPKVSIEKVRAALLERAINVDEHITQELIADDLGSTPNTLRKLVSVAGWDAEVRRARSLAADSTSANGK